MPKSYRLQRLQAYPPVGEQLDVLWKIINQMRLNKVDLPEECDRMLNRILAVKRGIPKDGA